MPLRQGSGGIITVHMGNCSLVRVVEKCPTHAGNTGQLISEAENFTFFSSMGKMHNAIKK